MNSFSLLAKDYQEYRPDYPTPLLVLLGKAIDSNATGTEPHIVLDVGSGTGISTRQIAAVLNEKFLILGVEPNENMRLTAKLETEDPRVTYTEGIAERLPAGDGVIVGIVAAQAAQWFDREAFYSEAARVLAPNATIAVIQNNRDWRSCPFLDAYESLLERNGDHYSRHYREIDFATELSRHGFMQVRHHEYIWKRSMSISAFEGMSRSSTKMQAAIQRVGEARILEELRQLLQTYGNLDEIEIGYRSELFLASQT